MTNQTPGQNDGWWEKINKILVSLGTFISLAMLMISVYQAIKGDRDIGYLLFFLTLAFLFLALGVAGFGKRTTKIPGVVLPDGSTSKIESKSELIYPQFYKCYRIGFIAVLVIGIISGSSLFTDQQNQQMMISASQTKTSIEQTKAAQGTQSANATSTVYAIATATQRALADEQEIEERRKKLFVVIAAFDGPEERYGLRDKLVESLLINFQNDENIEIIPINDVVTPLTGSKYARQLGESHFADIVIWAWYKPTENPNITIYFENLSTDSIKTIQGSQTYQPQATISDLESFEIQHKIGAEASTLVFFITGLFAYRNEDYLVAIEKFENILKLNDSPTVIKPSRLYAHLGASNERLNNNELALQSFDKAIELDLEYVWAYSYRGYVYSNLAQYERAIQDYGKAIELDPNTWTYFDRGLAYYTFKQYERAIQDYDKVIELNPEYVWAYTSRGNAYSNLAQYERAIQDYGKAIELDPNAWTYFDRGLAYYTFKQYDLAIRDYDKAIEFDAQFSVLYEERGNAYYALSQYRQAILNYNKAIELDPEFEWAYYGRGLTYYALGQYERAIQDYDKAIEFDPNFVLAYFDRGVANNALGKIAEAEADFAKHRELIEQANQ